MPDQGDRTPIEPGMPEGINAGLVSSTGAPLYRELGAGRTSGRRSGPSSTGMLDQGKARLADGLHVLGDRIEHTGRDLESGNAFVRPVGRVLDRAGNSIEGGANYLRTHGIGVIGDDFVDGIRHRPLVSAGVAVGVGWMLGRMMGGGDEDDHRREASSRDEHREGTHKRERAAASTLDRVKGRVTELVASGIALMAARRIRDRIAGA
jgi:hypothetical protein